MYESILVATDGSAHALEALSVALELAEPERGVVYVLNVPERPKANDALGIAAGAPDLNVSREEVLQHGQNLIAEVLSKVGEHRGASVVPIARLGDPVDVILEEAEQRHVDAIVLGSRGMSDFKSMVMGSVSHKVAHLAPCKTVVVH